MTGSPSSACPEEDSLEALVAGRLGEAEMSSLEAHLETCGSCLARIEELSALGEVERSSIAATETPDEDRLREAAELGAVLKKLPTGSAPTTDRPYVVPEQLGRNQVQEVIAKGGMGVVLKAWDPDLERSVAIKQLSPDLADEEEARERFIREARAVAALDHENILPIFAVETDPEAPYLVMPLVDGESLQQRLDRSGALDREELLSFARKMVAGLSFAHQQGIVHRDLKPGNILLDRDGRRLWIADFGLARAPGVAHQPTEISGTPSFMAPEQLAGADTDQRADLFSLGATLYAMATGQPPFEAVSIDRLTEQIVDHDAPPPHEVNPDLDPKLGQIIQRLLEKNPADRFQSADEVAQAMDELPAPAGAGKLIWTAIAALVLALILLVIQARQPPNEAPPVGTSDPGSPYLITGRDGENYYFDDLGRAVEHAPHGGTVEIQLDGEHPFPAVDLGQKDLILRAAPGHDPTLDVQGTSAPAISSRGRLWLEGLAFKRRSAAGVDYPIVSASGPSLWINNCWFSIDSSGEVSAPPPACIEVVDCEDFLLLNSSVLSQRFCLISSRNSKALGRQRIELRNCALLGLWTVAFDQPAESRSEVVVEDSLLVCRVGFYSLNQHRIVNSKFEVRRNIFDTRYSLITIAKAFSGQVRPEFDWRGEANIYNPGASFVEGNDRTRRVRGIGQLAGWKILVDEADSSVEARTIDRDVLSNTGGENIASLDLREVLRQGSDGRELPPAGPEFDRMNAHENWHRWKQTAPGAAWRAEKMEQWKRGSTKVPDPGS